MGRQSYADDQITAGSFSGTSSPKFLDAIQIARGLFKHGVECAAGTVAGTGASLDVVCPFDPAVVIILNETDGSVHIATPTTGAAKGMSIKAAAAWMATVGITIGDKKFTLGTNADLNAAADVLHWVAFGFRDLSPSS